MASLGDVAPAAPPGGGDDDDPKKKKPGQSLADVVAAPYVRPLDWQAPAPRDSYGGRGVEVGMTPDLQRVIDLPRRPPVDPESPQAAALVEYVTRKYARDRGGEPCKCQKIDRKQPCITRLRSLQAIMLHEMSLVGGAIGALFVGSGKCCDASVEIFDYASGSRRSVADEGAVRVASLADRLRVASASAFPSGVKQCVVVELRDGTKIITSNDHPILTSSGWVHACEIKIGDLVAVAASMPEPERETVASDEEIAFVAYMLSDGGCSQRTMTFTNMTPSVIADWQTVSRALGYGCSENVSKSKARQFNLTHGRRADHVRERWGLYGLAKDKRAHASIWGLPRAQVALFLNRFWACDGHISGSGIEITLASDKLIDDLRFLMLRLGVRSNKSFTPKAYRKNGETHGPFDAWTLHIYASDALQFLAEVGDVLGKETACIALRVSLGVKRRNPNHDVVPISATEFVEICDELGYRARGTGTSPGEHPRGTARQFLWPTPGQFVSRAKFIEFCRRWNYTGKYAYFANPDVAWERVVGNTPVGPRPVYDLSVPGTHNFVANGVIIHNTLIGVLAPLALPDCKTAVVLVPASLVDQFVTNYRIIAEHFRVPGLIVHRGKGKEPERFAVSDAPVTHLMSYNRLSSPDASDLLDRIAPDAIIADECDALCDTKSVRTRRFLRMYQKRPSTRFAGWTGSLTDAKISEYATLLALALRLGSPLPLDPAVTAEWGCALDASDFPAPPGRLMDLCMPGEDVRAGFQRRLRDTAGFIASIKSEVRIEGTDELVRLGISVRPAPPLPQIIDEALKKVRLFQRPDSLAPTGPVYDDEELDDPMLQAKCAIDVASGMFHRWIFPRGEPRPLIDEWFAARKLYNKEVRELLMADVPFMDSPHLAEMAARRHHGDAPPAELIDGRPNPAEPHWPSQHWPRWRDVKDRVEPKSQAVRLHGYLVEDAAQWAHESPGIVWYGTVEFGEWLAQVSGLPLHRGGAGAGARILAEGGDRSIIASVHSHGRGRDGLQRRFSTQLYTQPFSSARNPEQWLGRLHRPGQTENLVSTYVYAHIPELRKAYRQALTRSRYVHGTLGAEQKLLTGWQGFGNEDEDDDDDLF